MNIKIIVVSIVLWPFIACKNTAPIDVRNAPVEANILPDTSKTWNALTGYPKIKDSSIFISNLCNSFDIERHERITAFEKIKLFGSDKDYFLIEYDYEDGPSVAYPWKYQLILDSSGKLLKKMSNQQYSFIRIFDNQNPFLLMLNVTSKGNGGHELYKITNDTLENVYEGYYDYTIRTYDLHQDDFVFQPTELDLSIKDMNHDGFKDMIFKGTKLFLDDDGQRSKNKQNIAIEYVFLYDKITGHFKAMKDYTN